jgi:hypothetical protein
MDRSEVLRGAFMEYAKSLGLIKEEVLETITQFGPHSRRVRSSGCWDKC